MKGIIVSASYAARNCRSKRGKYRPKLKERPRWDFRWRRRLPVHFVS
jgi:hypothetical protein